jgi:demethylmenaquinone methyltransferase / 2-methoxy-6-polyprenyl-1,4-benzoquinol methylase
MNDTASNIASPNSAPLAASVDVKAMFDRIASRYDAANRVMSMGIDVLWRRQALATFAELPDDAIFLDLGAGTLDGTAAIATSRPRARVCAADFAGEMLRAGSPKVSDTHARVALHQADGHVLPYRDGVFDGVFSAFCVRNLVRLDVALAELARVTRPGARVAVLEFFRPVKPRWFFDGIYNRHILPLIGWAITGDRAAYQYLPESIGRFDSTHDFETRLRVAGFTDVSTKNLFPGAIASLITATRGNPE